MRTTFDVPALEAEGADSYVYFCMDCYSAHSGKHRCTNPRPEGDLSGLNYYHGRREYLARQKADKWGDNDARSPEEARA